MKRTKGWFSVLACLALLMAACQFAARLPGSILPASNDSGSSPVSSTTPAPELAKTEDRSADGAAAAATHAPGLVLSARTTRETAEKPKYEVEARWPVLEWGTDPRVNAFNQAAEDFVSSEIRSFTESIRSLPDEPAFAEHLSTLQIDFTPTSSDKGIVSVLFQISFYTAGAAHPGHYSHTLNYDLRAGKVFTLEDIFQDSSGYLEIIAGACATDLKARGVLEWEDGAAPMAQNYQDWNITPQGLLITFEEYQVASYAAGPQSVMVPHETIQPLLKPDGPLAGYYTP